MDLEINCFTSLGGLGELGSLVYSYLISVAVDLFGLACDQGFFSDIDVPLCLPQGVHLVD
jgi:hypothetical protein